MYLLKEDVDKYESYLERFIKCEKGEYNYSPEEGSSVDFFFAHPYLILPLGFDEARHLVDASHAEWLEESYEKQWLRRAVKEARLVESKYGLSDIQFDFGVETIFRSESHGAWYWLLGLENEELIFRGPDNTKTKYGAAELLKKLRALTEYPDHVPRTLWLPRIWTPEFQDHDRQKISNDVSALLQSLKNESSSLRDIKPTIFEELVAELLRSRGMEVHVTKKTHDGGRDIIARCESALGDPISFAIEVKQKNVVGIQDVRSALKANEHFPALMLATSGRFSSGVIEEKRREGNSLRLMLKDGIALSQWIASYSPNHELHGNAFQRTMWLSRLLR